METARIRQSLSLAQRTPLGRSAAGTNGNCSGKLQTSRSMKSSKARRFFSQVGTLSQALVEGLVRSRDAKLFFERRLCTES